MYSKLFKASRGSSSTTSQKADKYRVDDPSLGTH